MPYAVQAPGDGQDTEVTWAKPRVLSAAVPRHLDRPAPPAGLLADHKCLNMVLLVAVGLARSAIARRHARHRLNVGVDKSGGPGSSMALCQVLADGALPSAACAVPAPATRDPAGQWLGPHQARRAR